MTSGRSSDEETRGGRGQENVVGGVDGGEGLVMEGTESQDEEWAEEGQLPGYIFMCSKKTKPECFTYRVFGLPVGKMEVLLKIKPGTRLFLFDFEVRLLYGVYVAASDGGMGLEPAAFGGRFPAQVKFDIFKECLPLPETIFKNVIKENYQGGAKFRQELSYGQVRELISLFRPLFERSLPTHPDLVKPSISLGQRFSDQTLDHKEPVSGLPHPLHLSQLASKFLTPKYGAVSTSDPLDTQALHRRYEQANLAEIYDRPGYLESYKSLRHLRSGTHHSLGEPIVPSEVATNASYRHNLLSLPSILPMPSSSRGAAYWAAVAASSEDLYSSSVPPVKPSENAELGAYHGNIYPSAGVHGGRNHQPSSSGHEPSVVRAQPMDVAEAGVINETVSHLAAAYSTAAHHEGKSLGFPGSHHETDASTVRGRCHVDESLLVSRTIRAHQSAGASGYSNHEVGAPRHLPALASAGLGAIGKTVITETNHVHATAVHSMDASGNLGAYHIAAPASQTVEQNVHLQPEYATSEAGAQYGNPAPNGSVHWPHSAHWAQNQSYSGSEAVYWAQHQGHYASQGDHWTQGQGYYISHRQQPSLPSYQSAPVSVDQATHGYWAATAPGYSSQADTSQPVMGADHGSGYRAISSTAGNTVYWPGAGYGVSGQDHLTQPGANMAQYIGVASGATSHSHLTQ
ncbi:DCD domain-containing protein [Drosera capensis]